MKEEIKELRIKIDGLAQLTKELKPIHKFIIDAEAIPHNMTLEEWTKKFKENWYVEINSNQLTDSNNKAVHEVKHEYKEIEKAVDSLYLAKAWLGKVLGELGNENPYGSRYKTKEDIVPTQDVAEPALSMFLTDKGSWDKINHIQKTDWLRTEIEKLVLSIKEIPVGETVRLVDMNSTMPEQSKFVPFSREFAIARTNSYNHLCEAGFALGFELERLRDKK